MHGLLGLLSLGQGILYCLVPIFTFFSLCLDRYFRYAHSEDQYILDITVLGKTLDKYHTALTIGLTSLGEHNYLKQ